MTGRRRVAVVTGGGGGIGGAIAEQLGGQGWMVVTLDPLVTLDGTERLPDAEDTTVGRIVAAGGSARAVAASVTDAATVTGLFEELAGEHGGLDAVVNVAGITRQSGFAHGTEADWTALLDVHLNGWLNVLGAALPLMAGTGRGRVLGVTSGSGWRAADAGAYSAAKRVVAALTWQIGRLLPPGVAVNAISPIAATRMVAAALERARAAGRAGGGGGLSLQGMPGPDDLGPIGAALVGDGFGWCRGQVLFTGGPEVAVVAPPRLLEVVRTEAVASLPRLLRAVVSRALASAEADQATTGATNPRFGPVFDEPGPAEPAASEVRTCLVVSEPTAQAEALSAALAARGIDCRRAAPSRCFAATAETLGRSDAADGPLDAVVVVCPRRAAAAAAEPWRQVLAAHAGIVDDLHHDGGWARGVADYSAASGRPVRLVSLVDATDAGGRSRAQAAAQLARVARATTDGRVSAFAVGLEAPEPAVARPAAELAAHLLADPGGDPLSGAELVVGAGWLGLRSHPRPVGSVTFGGPALPGWLEATLMEMAGAGDTPAGEGR